MGVKATSVVGLGLVLVLSVTSLVDAEDLRLVEAVRDQDRNAVRALLSQDVDVNTLQPDGATALHWAALRDDLETADLLIRAGAFVNPVNEYGVTPLLLAAENGSAAMIEKLLNRGANPNAAIPNGETPLMTAARTGTTDAVNALLAWGADVNAKETSQEQTALMWAAGEGHTQVARTLIEHGADVQARTTGGFTPLAFAVRQAHLPLTKALLAAGANLNEAAEDGTTPLLVATVRGHTKLAQFLLEQGADPNVGAGHTPLHWVAGEWNIDLTGRVAENTEWSVFGGLTGQEKSEMVTALLAHGADPNARVVRTPRRVGGGGGHAGNLAGATPFLLAAMAGDVSVMRALLDAGAAPLLGTNAGTTPLMMAAGLNFVPGATRVPESRALEAVKLCLAMDADIHAANAAGDTALHGAAYRGGDLLVQFLADSGARVNVRNRKRWSPLTIAEGHFAVGGIQRFPTTEALLLTLGAEPTPPDVLRCDTDGHPGSRAGARQPSGPSCRH